jgi:hypothetical protein
MHESFCQTIGMQFSRPPPKPARVDIETGVDLVSLLRAERARG